MPKQQWLALQNLVVPRGSEWLILNGAVLDDHNRGLWLPAMNLKVAYTPVGYAKIVQAGSLFEADLPKSRIRIWQSAGALVEPGDSHHFDLEVVFNQSVPYLSRNVVLAEVLRAYGVYTLEGVVANEPGSIPFSESSSADGKPVPIRAQELLAQFVDAETVQELVADAQAAVASTTPHAEPTERDATAEAKQPGDFVEVQASAVPSAAGTEAEKTK